MGLEAGLVKVIGLDLSDRFVQVDYTAGFDIDPHDSKQSDLLDVPDWLETAAMMEARIGLNDHPFLKERDESPTLDPIKAMVFSIVAMKARDLPEALEPLAGG